MKITRNPASPVAKIKDIDVPNGIPYSLLGEDRTFINIVFNPSEDRYKLCLETNKFSKLFRISESFVDRVYSDHELILRG